MEPKLIVLKLFLDALNVDCNIKDVSSRKAIQKAVYLGQLSGIDLGYRYGWYKLGPYCSSLTDDFYNLVRGLRVEDQANLKKLPSHISEKLQPIKAVMQPPASWALPKEDWLELLASYHYLLNVRKRTHGEALEILRKEKPTLAPFVEIAQDTLKKLPQQK
jgi:hypothetical protein